MASCGTGSGATHYAGCPCHEAEWEKALADEARKTHQAAFEATKYQTEAVKLRAKVEQLQTALRSIANWRRTADEYDEQCENSARDYREDIELIERYAANALEQETE